MMGDPPTEIAPARLFRLLLGRPPRIALPPLPGAECCPLFVRALRNAEFAEVRDDPRSLALVVKALVLPNGSQVFSSADQAAESLQEHEAERWLLAVSKALAIVSPTYLQSRTRAWHRALLEGARAASNLHDAYVLGLCVDEPVGGGLVKPRPERYFGGAQADLTDGHWMAFRAARALVREIEKEHKA